MGWGGVEWGSTYDQSSGKGKGRVGKGGVV